MTTREQDEIAGHLASEHGATRVLPLVGCDSVLMCGWDNEHECRVSEWLHVLPDGDSCPAWGVEVAFALEAEDARSARIEPSEADRVAA